MSRFTLSYKNVGYIHISYNTPCPRCQLGKPESGTIPILWCYNIPFHKKLVYILGLKRSPIEIMIKDSISIYPDSIEIHISCCLQNIFGDGGKYIK